jgi:RNA polymerase sigma-70 factor (ECF subfamily)
MLDARLQSAGAQATPDHGIVAALLRCDESAFLSLVKRHHRTMIQLARLHLRSEDRAEDVVQDCWLIVLRSLKQWTGRGSLRSWIFGIVANQARSRAIRESRTVPLSMLQAPEADPCSGAVPSREGWQWSVDADRADGWSSDSLERREVLDTIWTAIEALPARQRAVITLRDVSGCDGPETCAALGISEVNQRVLLHRARMKVRGAVEAHLRN